MESIFPDPDSIEFTPWKLEIKALIERVEKQMATMKQLCTDEKDYYVQLSMALQHVISVLSFNKIGLKQCIPQ